MRVRENLLEVIDPRGNVRGKGRADADIVVRNYPIEGPMLSAPHEQPFACATQQFNLPGGAGNLGAPLDANCSIARRVDYFYKSTTNTGNNLTSRRDDIFLEHGLHDDHRGQERALHRAHGDRARSTRARSCTIRCLEVETRP